MENITYEEFIQNILDTRGRFACGDEYHERHHIIPRCCGGLDNEDNLVDLFAREHYEAHRLLALENPENNSLQYAWWMMSNHSGMEGQNRYITTPLEYEECKIKFSNTMKKVFANPENHPMFGKHLSEEARKKISDATKGRPGPNLGKHFSEETKTKISMAAKERFSDKRNHPMYGKHLSEEVKNNLSEKAKERFENPENHPNYGKSISEEQKEKISNKLKERFSDPTNHPMYGKGTPVVQLTETYKFISEYSSANMAENITGIYNITKSCKQKGALLAGGYRWMYKEDWSTLELDVVIVKNNQKHSLSKSNTSGIAGVSYYKSNNKWKSYIYNDGKVISLGYYFDKEDAIRARLEAEAKYYGEYAPQRYLFEQYGITIQNELRDVWDAKEINCKD